MKFQYSQINMVKSKLYTTYIYIIRIKEEEKCKITKKNWRNTTSKAVKLYIEKQKLWLIIIIIFRHYNIASYYYKYNRVLNENSLLILSNKKFKKHKKIERTL